LLVTVIAGWLQSSGLDFRLLGRKPLAGSDDSLGRPWLAGGRGNLSGIQVGGRGASRKPGQLGEGKHGYRALRSGVRVLSRGSAVHTFGKLLSRSTRWGPKPGT
jgi:hypothetical protein